MKKPKKKLMRARRNGKLRPKDEAFCQDVASGVSATQAYRTNIAEFQIKTTSAQSEAWKLMQKPEIKLCIAKLRENDKRTLEEQHGFGREQVLRELIEAWHTPVGEVDESHRFCQEYTVTAGEEFSQTKVKMINKLDVLKEFGKIVGLYPAQGNGNGNGGGAPQVVINLGALYSPALGQGEDSGRRLRTLESQEARLL